MQKTLTKIIVFSVVMLALGAFGLRKNSPEPQVNVSQTAMIETMVSGFFQTQTANAPQATPTPIPSATPLPTQTQILITLPPPPSFNTAAPTVISLLPTFSLATAIPNQVGTGSGSTDSGCYNLKWIEDTSIPDGTTINSRTDFKKSWRVQNTGTCSWQASFTLVLLSGEDMDIGASARLRKQILAGDKTEITVDLTAPKKPGKYTSIWQMSDGTKAFGEQLSVRIVVP